MTIKKQSNRKNPGFIFLEILIAIGLISIVFVLMLGIGFQSVNISTGLQRASGADSFIKEQMEAVRSFRDGTTWQTNGLGSLATGQAYPYYMAVDENSNPKKWVLNQGTQTSGIFTKKIVFEKVSRNPANLDIESIYNASRDDPNTKKATVTVTWDNNASQVSAYFTNWK